MAQIPVRFVSFFHMIGVLIIAFCVETDRTGLPSIMVPLAMGTFIPVSKIAFNLALIQNISQQFIVLGIHLLMNSLKINNRKEDSHIRISRTIV